MAKDKVVIRWNTKCAWNGKEQPIARKTIDPPSPANLVVGQKVRVKFSGRWYDAFVVTPWIKKPRGKSYRWLFCIYQAYAEDVTRTELRRCIIIIIFTTTIFIRTLMVGKSDILECTQDCEWKFIQSIPEEPSPKFDVGMGRSNALCSNLRQCRFLVRLKKNLLRVQIVEKLTLFRLRQTTSIRSKSGMTNQ